MNLVTRSPFDFQDARQFGARAFERGGLSSLVWAIEHAFAAVQTCEESKQNEAFPLIVVLFVVYGAKQVCTAKTLAAMEGVTRDLYYLLAYNNSLAGYSIVAPIGPGFETCLERWVASEHTELVHRAFDVLKAWLSLKKEAQYPLVLLALWGLFVIKTGTMLFCVMLQNSFWGKNTTPKHEFHRIRPLLL